MQKILFRFIITNLLERANTPQQIQYNWKD